MKWAATQAAMRRRHPKKTHNNLLCKLPLLLLLLPVENAANDEVYDDMRHHPRTP